MLLTEITSFCIQNELHSREHFTSSAFMILIKVMDNVLIGIKVNDHHHHVDERQKYRQNKKNQQQREQQQGQQQPLKQKRRRRRM